MGTAVTGILYNRGHETCASFDTPASKAFGRDAGESLGRHTGVTVSPMNYEAAAACDCIIDFSAPAATMEILKIALKAGKPIVTGTTGLSPEQKAEIEKASSFIPVLFSPNMAVGVNMLFKLVETAAAAMPADFDVEIMETHHRLKKDAPSGTAKRLAELVKVNMPGMENAAVVTGRDGIIGERPEKEIGLMALRGGDVVGDHTVYFIGQGERIELTCRSTNRDTLAYGAVLAAEFLKDRPAGSYSMYDVLGL